MAGQTHTEQALGDDLRTGPAPRPLFTRISQGVSKAAGKPVTFIGAVVVILIWGATGPLFGYNDTWQLIINTSTTIITFLMVFLIQNTQNRANDELHIKIDELLRTTRRAHKALLDLEDMDPAELHALRKQYRQMAGQGNDAQNTKE